MVRSRTRKRKAVTSREPSGRPSRTDPAALVACSPAEVRRLRDAALAGMQSAEWGTELGRLFLNGKINAPCFAAGKRWAELATNYRDAIGAPQPSPKAASIERRGHTGAVDPDSESGAKQAARDRETVLNYTDAHRALSGAGMLSEQAVRAACERNELVTGVHALGLLNVGLSRLSLFWGLTTER